MRKSLNSLVAMVFAIFVPGLGHTYCGEINKCISYYMMLTFILMGSWLLGLMHLIFTAVVVLALILSLWIYTIREAIRIAVRKKESKIYRYNSRWGELATAAVLLVTLYSLFTIWGYSFLYVDIEGMSPTVNWGEIVMLDRHYNFNPDDAHDKVITFKLPPETYKNFDVPTIIMIKRIMAIPGETFQIKNGQAYHDDKPIDDSEIPIEYRSNHVSRDVPPIEVPKGYIYVLGDNRDNSYDSRHIGIVPIDTIKARALYILWSKNFLRIGKRL